MRPETDPYYKAQLKAVELEYMLDSPTVTNMPNRSIEVRNDDPKPLPEIIDRKSTRLNSRHSQQSRMPSSA